MALVDKDQLDILASLRASVSVEKVSLQADVAKLTSSVEELSQKNAMQLSQINSLLLDKFNLQSDGLSQREKMLERLQWVCRSSVYPVLWANGMLYLVQTAKRLQSKEAQRNHKWTSCEKL